MTLREQWEIRWIDYYQVFQLQSDAEAEVINAVYRKLAVKYHPDNQATGDEAKFKVLTEANEVLTDPVRRTRYDKVYEQYQHTTEQQQTSVDEHRQHETAARRAREEQRQRDEAERRRREEETKQKQQLPIVYPPFPRKTPWSVVNTCINSFMDQLGLDNDGRTLLGFFLGLFVICLPPALLIRLLSSLLGIRLEELSNYGVVQGGLLGSLGLLGTFVWGNLIAVDSLDTIQGARRPQTVWLAKEQAWKAIEQVLHNYHYHTHGWLLETRDEDNEDATEKQVAKLLFSLRPFGALHLDYSVMLTIKVKDAGMGGASQVCYWFDTQGPWYWLFPASTVAKYTNAALLKALPGKH